MSTTSFSPYNVVSSEITDFTNFFASTHVIPIAVAFIIAAQITQLSSNFVDDILSPIISVIINEKDEESLKNTYIDIFGARIMIGSFIASLLKFIIMLIIIYYVVKFTVGKI